MIVNIIENLMIIVIIADMGIKGIVKVLKGSGEYMTEKRLCKFSLTGFQCLVFYKLIQQGKRIILVGDNKFKVVDNND